MFGHSKMQGLINLPEPEGLQKTVVQLDVFGARSQKRLQLCQPQSRSVNAPAGSVPVCRLCLILRLRWSNWVFVPILRQFCLQGKKALEAHGHWDIKPTVALLEKKGKWAAASAGFCCCLFVCTV